MRYPARTSRATTFIRVGERKVEVPPQVRGSQSLRPRSKAGVKARGLGRRQLESDELGDGLGVRATLTTIYFSTLPLSTQTATSNASTKSTLDPLSDPTSRPPLASLTTLPSSPITTSTSPIVTSSTSASGIKLASPPGFPTALVASLCTLIPLAFLITLFFYLYYRHRHPTPAPSVASEDKYVWGPFGLIRRKDKDKDRDRDSSISRSVGDRERRSVRFSDPIAEAIREEERDRLGRMRRNGEARFYAEGVRHLVEFVGSRERMRVVIDWRERMSMGRMS